MSSDKWYLAVLVVSTWKRSSRPDQALTDFQYRLIQAADASQAYARALAVGREESFSYCNMEGEQVQWSFLGLADLQEIREPQLRHGLEIYSELRRECPARHVSPMRELTVFRRAAPREEVVPEPAEALEPSDCPTELNQVTSDSTGSPNGSSKLQ